jgi:hypothetical protein
MTIKLSDIDVYFYIKNHLLSQNEQSKIGDTCAYFSADQSVIDRINKEVETLYTDESLRNIINGKSEFFINGVRYWTCDYFYEEDDNIDYNSLRYDLGLKAVEQYVINTNEPVQNCAVGCLIDKNHYHPSIENSSILELGVIRAVVKSNPQWEINFPQLRMLKLLQVIHDNVLPLNWNTYFNMIEQSDLFSHENNAFVFNVENFVPFEISGGFDGLKDHFNRIVDDVSKLSFAGIDLSLID